MESPNGMPMEIPWGSSTGTPHREYPWGILRGKGNPPWEYSWDSWGIPMGILTGHGESPWGLMGNPHGDMGNTHGTPGESPGIPHGESTWDMGTLETRPGGRTELRHGRFLLDLGIFASVEQALNMAENCSTPCPRPGIRPRHFCLGRIPGLRPGVEQVLARMGGWLDPRRNAWVEIPPDPEILAGGGRP